MLGHKQNIVHNRALAYEKSKYFPYNRVQCALHWFDSYCVLSYGLCQYNLHFV